LSKFVVIRLTSHIPSGESVEVKAKTASGFDSRTSGLQREKAKFQSVV